MKISKQYLQTIIREETTKLLNEKGSAQNMSGGDALPAAQEFGPRPVGKSWSDFLLGRRFDPDLKRVVSDPLGTQPHTPGEGEWRGPDNKGGAGMVNAVQLGKAFEIQDSKLNQIQADIGALAKLSDLDEIIEKLNHIIRAWYAEGPGQ